MYCSRLLDVDVFELEVKDYRLLFAARDWRLSRWKRKVCFSTLDYFVNSNN